MGGAVPPLDRAQLWDELASLFESIQGNPVLAARSEVALWFSQAWPYLRADIEQLTGADAVAAVQVVTPFLFGGAMWPDLADVSRRGRDMTPGLEHLGDHLTFIHHLGIALQKMDDPIGAQIAFEEVVQRADAAGQPVLRARALAHQAQLRRSQGEPGDAMMLFHRAADTYRAVGDVLGEAKTLGDLAPAVAALGDRAGAEIYTERARTLFRSLGADHAEAVETRTLARLRASDGDLDAALALYDEVIRLLVAAGTPDEAAASALEVAQALARHDDLTGCRRYASLAEQLRSVNQDDLGREIAEIEEYVRTKTAVRLFADAYSDEAADRLIANHPELRTPMGLALAIGAQPARIERLAEHPDSAARLYVEDELQEARELAAGGALSGEVKGAIRRYLLAGPDGDIGLLEHLITLLPAATLPRVRGRYLLLLARRSSDDREVIKLAGEAAELLDTDAPDGLTGEAYAEAGMAWRRLSTGDARQNKEEALRCLRRALLSIRRRTDREGWGSVMIALANAYLEHPRERRRNLRRAVYRFEAALTVLDMESSPEGYATAHAGLGLALSDPDLADDPHNLEAARDHLERALGLLSTPATVASVLLNLSRCYSLRLQGDVDANRELAMHYARQSYELNSDLERTVEAAKAAVRVGSQMAQIARPTDRDAWAEVLDWFRKALDGLSKEETPSEYAEAVDNLANAMSAPPGAVEAFFDEIAAFRLEAAQVYHEIGDEREWARAVYNLAGTLSQGQPPDHDKIVQLYKDSLRGRPVDDAPTEWAESITDLARALIRRDRDGDVDRAEDLLRQAQATGTPATASDARALLGRLLAGRGDWSGAAEQLSVAAADAETRYLSTMLSAGREAVLTRTAGLPRETAYALARDGRYAEAVALVENARARDLGQLLDRDRADLTAVEAVDPAAATAFREAVSHMAAAEAAQRTTFRPTLDERRRLRALLTDAQAWLHSSVEAIRAVPGFGGFASPPDDAARRAARAGVPLVYLITAEFGSVALIVAGEEPVRSVFAPLTEAELVELLAGTPSLTSDPALLPRLIDLLGERFLGEVARQLVTARIGEVVVVATGLLGVLPVHAARYRRDGLTRHLQDEVVISFAPSAGSLVAARPHEGPLRLVGVADPKSNTLPALSHAAAETAAVRRLFPGDDTVLTGREATKPALVRELAGATHVHLACHGDFDISQPLRSGLYLYGDDVLTLGELFDIRPLAGVRLVVASACQSAVSDVMYAPDEATGLPAGLVYAGAETVAGTLWNLSDLVAPLLVGRFYAYYFQGDPETGAAPMSAAMAMARAQAWLRDSTIEEINRFADDTGLSRLPRLAFPGARTPFADQPRHWAPFVVVGPGAHVAIWSKW